MSKASRERERIRNEKYFSAEKAIKAPGKGIGIPNSLNVEFKNSNDIAEYFSQFQIAVSENPELKKNFEILFNPNIDGDLRDFEFKRKNENFAWNALFIENIGYILDFPNNKDRYNFVHYAVLSGCQIEKCGCGIIKEA